MLTLAVLIPLLASAVLALVPVRDARTCRIGATAVTAVAFALLLAVWAVAAPTEGYRAVAEVPWVPSLGIAWRVGVDGMSLALALVTAVVFLAATAWPVSVPRARAFYAWLLFLAGVSIGLFVTLDLIVFYVFFDLSLVGMYFLIGRWGHGDAQHAAVKFFVYTLAGSLLILFGIIVLALAMPELTFDMRAIMEAAPVDGAGVVPGLILLAFVIGFGIKTPVFPLHTWLPPAHVNAPGPASAILAGVLLKMGTYGLVRLPLQMMPETFARFALPLALLGLASILWGAIVAYAQANLKRRIAYTSVNHMGYVVLGIAVAGSGLGSEAARQLALTGAVVEMVAHGLITGALFLIAGAFWERTQDYDLANYGGLAERAPRLTLMATLGSFASLGLPGLAGFVAELHIFLGAFGVYPWIAAVGLLGLVVTAALFLNLLRQVFFGELVTVRTGFADLRPAETAVLAGLLALVVLIGIWPTWLLDLIDAGGVLAAPGAGG
ncbi:NADH-quinone oxidoreductase subunit M (plasmid) [Roseivivax marinus]|uniref:complex I subunit 4 family protein n=1 Tax=Roseivivax marinus TaxID=1379903 RepID=UPI001F042940|nr:NADH-quinone oxidoreductase subunit M [Roseivivax marinus]UMA66898.1 NADH-quinone oxidoreductase subunit M [Roseivivax marinus]UMA67379.1 NADH-quinone oxidoreductase subunit M [Roseivivax marinus]